MSLPKIHIIAAIQKNNRGLGFHNELLWKIPEDLKRFKALTTGHPIIMGRKTYESIGCPLPNRTNIVITRNADYVAPGCFVATSLGDALDRARSIETQHAEEKNDGAEQKIFIIGGAEIYNQALPFADVLHLTLIDGDKEADAFFPDYAEFKKEIWREDHPESSPSYLWVDLNR